MSEFERIRKGLLVKGYVQGVGFRPFVHRTAVALALSGFVRNEPEGVRIEIEGKKEAVSSFIHILQKNPPRLAKITSFDEFTLEPTGLKAPFEIVSSQMKGRLFLSVPPDVSTCPNCVHEIFDAQDRRFLYPFTNCTDCGPRYTIIAALPYDRKQTTMSIFKMCPDCEREYNDLADRRHHAQPNACPVCGPKITLLDSAGNKLLENYLAIQKVKKILHEGGIVAVKSLGGFQLACDAQNEDAVTELRRRKKRPGKPFAVMVPNIEGACKIASIENFSRRLLEDPSAPIALCPLIDSGFLAPSVCGELPDVGLMLPFTPIHYLLIYNSDGVTPTFSALVMTSGNLSEEPICIENDEAVHKLKGIADFFLVHDRPILTRCDDSVIMSGKANLHTTVRIGRGLSPRRVQLNGNLPPVLALGAGLKNTVCLTRDDEAFISQHIGDLDDESNADFLAETVSHMINLIGVSPEAVACDLHPDFFSTRYAERLGLKNIFKIQHHYAHILSVMGEYAIEEPVIGVALDGTGLGEDGAIWGGDVFEASLEGFSRIGRLEYLPLAGGDVSTAKPWRIALSYLKSLEIPSPSLEKWETLYPVEFKVICDMLKANLNSPFTSSVGRLFDAVSALLDLRHTVSFEAEAAMILEAKALSAPTRIVAYPNVIRFTDSLYEILLSPLFEGIIFDMFSEKIGVDIIAIKFHNFLIESFCELVKKAHNNNKIKKVVLSGGAFQNRLLLSGIKEQLCASGFQVFTPVIIPVNDAGISFGQAVYARLRAGGF